MDKKVTCLIPARYGSTRLPGKPLKVLAGKTLIEWVWLRAKEAETVDRVIIATDDKRILETVEGFGGECVMTDPDLPSGTDRIASAIENQSGDIIINLQGDEPLFPGKNLDLLANVLINNPELEMATLGYPLNNWNDVENPNVVKVVTDINNMALYFSRSPIPYLRDKHSSEFPAGLYMKHLGVYAYRRDVLQKFVSLPQSNLEKTEKLEQLRAIENSIEIKVIQSLSDSIGVDTPEDLARAETILNESLG